MRLEIESRLVGEVAVMRCSGRLVAGPEVEALQDKLKQALPQTPGIVLQLANLGFVDSSGLGTMVRSMSRARTAGGDLKLCCVPEAILKTLQLTHLATVFDVHKTEEDAISACYRKLPGASANTSTGLRRVMCFEQSEDLLAYLREMLRQAGYRALTASLLPDAQILIKATRPELILVGRSMASSGEAGVRDWLARIAPNIPVLFLQEDFSTCDPGEAGPRLIEGIRGALASP